MQLQEITRYHLKHSIPQKLQTLIIHVLLMPLIGIGRECECLSQEPFSLEMISDDLLNI